jgi:hypothetical protein
MGEDTFDLATDGLQPLFVLDHRQRMIVASYVHNEGFIILQRMMEDGLRLLNQKLVNTEAGNDKEVVANHHLVKAAGLFYATLIQRIKEEVILAGNEASTVGSIGDPERPFYPAEFEGQEQF